MLEEGRSTKLVFANLRRRWIAPLSVLMVLMLWIGQSARAQMPPQKEVLILDEVGLSHTLTNLMHQEIVTGVQQVPGVRVEFSSETLDLGSFSETPSPTEMRNWLAQKYRRRNLDVVVAVGPDTIKFVSDFADTLFPGVPIVICGSAEDQAGHPTLTSRFTGTWQLREPGKTVEAALHLFPNTQHIFVVGGSSVYDRVVMTATKDFFSSFQTKAQFSYLNDREMGNLLEQLRKLPENSVVFYTSFFQDSVGKRFVNATQALPMIAAAANAPIFGMSDTYLGHGIVGGDVMDFQEQGKITARIVSKLLEGKRASDIPIANLPSVIMFDWNELQRWQVPDDRLPPGSRVLFRKPSLWDRFKGFLPGVFLIALGLSLIATYLYYNRKHLKLAKEGQKQLSSMLINAEEQERHRIASELHDDFSQRLAVLALGLENLDEAMPDSFSDAHQRLHKLLRSTSELGTDLHTLSHRLHSSTLESLGLVPAVGALCKEFTAQQGVKVEFTSTEIPRSLQSDTALCVFRIVQEGLRNLKKHSGAAEAWVDVRKKGDRLEVTVRDEGCGLDTKNRHLNQGIGLRSMEARALSLGGEFKILSRPGKGTTLQAWVPLRLDQNLVTE
jgi:signal transduction histidine kinase